MRNPILLLAAMAVAGCANTGPSPSAYSGEQAREIKALSSKDIADLREGRGMGLAKAAELNGYPGPAHVLELADRLALTAEQRARIEAIHARMAHAARTEGHLLVEAERELDASFRHRDITPGALASRLDRIAAHQARVRHAHLLSHLEVTAVLTPQQVARYDVLRGYAGSHSH